MNLKFPNVSGGYIGVSSKNLTLNSSFYYEVFKNDIFLETRIPFIQRVPRLGFFDELIHLEDKNFKQVFYKCLDNLKAKLTVYLEDLVKNREIILNLLCLLLRMGESEYILKLNFPRLIHLETYMEFKYIQEIARVEVALANEKVIELGPMIQLAEIGFDSKIDLNLKLVLLNKIIVNTIRYGFKISEDILNKYTNEILSILNEFDENTFRNGILKSFIYRGISMQSRYGTRQQNQWLEKAEYYARSIKTTSTLEQIVASENLYTYLQTLSKWNILQKQYPNAEKALQEMIMLSPNDSTAYSELELFLMKMDKYEEALENFKAAITLGPPSVGMNAYFGSICSRHLGNMEDAISLLYDCTAYDPVAISPWLEIYEHYLSQQEIPQAQKVAKYILSKNFLIEQLEAEELTNLAFTVKN